MMRLSNCVHHFENRVTAPPTRIVWTARGRDAKRTLSTTCRRIIYLAIQIHGSQSTFSWGHPEAASVKCTPVGPCTSQQPSNGDSERHKHKLTPQNKVAETT
ncbi:hypothetical protein C0Q70_16306 [Pomacea canaliculata]|uniref:Uncharacterized protein n=1 Tax=Pomacea canaliculata TaxID=400727 RepID=A0A2T7NPE5_POMCA|nr:hypothetical protein C0Q70_16306 [Pomacea canaliculata]